MRARHLLGALADGLLAEVDVEDGGGKRLAAHGDQRQRIGRRAQLPARVAPEGQHGALAHGAARADARRQRVLPVYKSKCTVVCTLQS